MKSIPFLDLPSIHKQTRALPSKKYLHSNIKPIVKELLEKLRY